MVNIYILYIRSILETSAVVWHSSITQAETSEIERVQKVALRIILGGEYEDYKKALNISGLQTLSDRRIALCKQFAKNCTKSSKMSHIFPLNQHTVNTRNPEKYFVSPASTGRLANSAIPYMQRLLNAMWNQICANRFKIIVSSELLLIASLFYNKNPLSLSLSPL